MTEVMDEKNLRKLGEYEVFGCADTGYYASVTIGVHGMAHDYSEEHLRSIVAACSDMQSMEPYRQALAAIDAAKAGEK